MDSRLALDANVSLLANEQGQTRETVQQIEQILDEHEQAANLLRIHNTRQAEWSSNFEHELGELKQKAVANASGVQESKTATKALGMRATFTPRHSHRGAQTRSHRMMWLSHSPRRVALPTADSLATHKTFVRKAFDEIEKQQEGAADRGAGSFHCHPSQRQLSFSTFRSLAPYSLVMR